MTVITPVRTRCPADLIEGIRAATRQHADWAHTSQLVASALRRSLPGPEILTEPERVGDPDGYRCHILHVEPDGSFSVTAMVWLPGQVTPIHDHVTWCVFGVLQGAEYEQLYALAPDGRRLQEVRRSRNNVGEVSGFAPPGDIHRVRNYGQDVAISIHVYGADITRLGSSIRRVYDLPVIAPAASSASPEQQG
jgi:predicted metal-dependent enzyme (double-stranded beta helix superfamily)